MIITKIVIFGPQLGNVKRIQAICKFDIIKSPSKVKISHFRLENCKKSCGEIEPPKNSDSNGLTFYDIVEKDLQGNEIKFDIFRGKVVYLVNVASHCGYTEENYAEFRSLNRRFKDQPFEIVLAPCNAFGNQEPGDEVAIENFAKNKGFKGTILSKAEVNGEDTRPSFQFLKALTGKSQIVWFVFIEALNSDLEYNDLDSVLCCAL